MGLLSGVCDAAPAVGEWAISNGCGYSVRMSTQLWMRDQIIEVLGPLPEGRSPARTTA